MGKGRLSGKLAARGTVPNRPRESSIDPYDDVPYTDHGYAESHPDRFAVVARMSGWKPPDLARARILELGCAVGGNLLPMAEQLPEATLVGVDRSARQIEVARRIASAAELENVTLHAASFLEIELPAASFDYVIAHGVYSWVSVDERRALLGKISRWLAPGGIGYVSFNTLPGWYDRMAAKDWLRFADATPSLGTTGKESLAWLNARVSPALDTYRSHIDRVTRRLAETSRAYLVHEYLSPDNRPELVSTFLAEADQAGLRYLGDGIPSATALELLDEEAQKRAAVLDVSGAQQLIDFVKCSFFRRALVVRGEDCEARAWRWPTRLDPRGIDGLRIASRLRVVSDPAGGADQIEGADGSVHVFDPAARRALRELASVAPRSLPFDELCRRTEAALAAEGSPPSGDGVRDAVRAELFDLWLAIGGLDLHAFEPRIGATSSERPVASAVARWHAQHGGAITNLWHQEVLILEDVVRFILGRLDGTRSCDAVTREVRDALGSGRVKLESAGERSARTLAAADVEPLVLASIDLLEKSALLR